MLFEGNQSITTFVISIILKANYVNSNLCVINISWARNIVINRKNALRRKWWKTNKNNRLVFTALSWAGVGPLIAYSRFSLTPAHADNTIMQIESNQRRPIHFVNINSSTFAIYDFHSHVFIYISICILIHFACNYSAWRKEYFVS